jgi:sirohydrochlorin ferrochelatase
MKALLVVAHGSRRQQSNEEVKLLASRLVQNCNEQYPIIHAAFLELADPLIPEGIKLCIDSGAHSVVVLPYFLNSGRHVVEDIPQIVNDTMKTYPEIEIKIAEHLGSSELMMELLISTANSAH